LHPEVHVPVEVGVPVDLFSSSWSRRSLALLRPLLLCLLVLLFLVVLLFLLMVPVSPGQRVICAVLPGQTV
jgi:hypothetical protein